MGRCLVVVVAVVLLLGVGLCALMFKGAAKPVTAAPATERCTVQYRPTDCQPHLVDLGLTTFPFSYHIPTNTQIYIWLECYREGKPFQPLSFSSRRYSEKNKTQAGGFRFSHFNPHHTTGKPGEQTRWILHFNSTASTGRWVPNVFATSKPNEIRFSWRHPDRNEQELNLGRTYTLMYVTGRRPAKDGSVSFSSQESEMKKQAFALLLKVRVDSFDPEIDPAGSVRSGEGIPPENPVATPIF